MYIQNTLTPYKELDRSVIQYGVCKDYTSISRYRGLRQIIHDPSSSERFTTLESPNPFTTNVELKYYEVPQMYENRLDLISNMLYGSPRYSWILSYFNRIEDGFTVRSGQKLVYPKSVTALLSSGEILQSIPATKLNIGEE